MVRLGVGDDDALLVRNWTRYNAASLVSLNVNTVGKKHGGPESAHVS